MPMENPFMAYGKGQAFPTVPQTGFPQHRRTWQFTHIPTTPTTATIHPILHGVKEKKEQKKNGSTAHGRTVKAVLPFCVWRSVRKSTFSSVFRRKKVGKGIIRAHIRKADTEDFFAVFEPLPPQFFDRLER